MCYDILGGVFLERLIESVLNAMQNELSSEQLKKLENVLIIKTRGFVLCKEKTSLDVRHEDWRNALRIYIASKNLKIVVMEHWQTMSVASECLWKH